MESKGKLDYNNKIDLPSLKTITLGESAFNGSASGISTQLKMRSITEGNR